jgi:hypothetical protein
MGKITGTLPNIDPRDAIKFPKYGSIPTYIDLREITEKKITLKRKEITTPTLMQYFKSVTIPDGQIVSYSYTNPW